MFNSIIATIEAFGWLQFGLLLLFDLILWRFHPILGVLGVLFTFALLIGLV